MKYSIGIPLLALFLVSIGTLWYWGPIPQDPAYHQFAEQRSIWGIPHFGDVVSNVPMFFLGMYVLAVSISRLKFWEGLSSRLMPIVLSLGIISASIGSMYYHWHPDNLTLVWDRLPMTLMFMPLLAMVFYDYLSPGIGKVAFWLLLLLGIFSVLYWHKTEQAGQGDLRLYAWVQFFPMFLAPLIIVLSPRKIAYSGALMAALLWYIFAKVAEHFDTEIFQFTQILSGHTLKHLLGVMSLWYVLQIIRRWPDGSPA